MKYFSLFVILVCISIQSYAQFNSDRLFYEGKVEKYKKLKTTGAALAIVGTGLCVVGIVTLVSQIDNTNSSSGGSGSYGSSSSSTASNSTVNTGAALWLVGLGCVGAGVPMWVVGGISQMRYEKKLDRLSVGLNLSPQQTGLKLRYRL